MDPDGALADLKQISAQVQEAVIFDGAGTVVASTLDGDRAKVMAEAAGRLLETAGHADEAKPVVQIEAALADGSVVVVREGDAAVAATTLPDPTIGLIFYDLRTCLRALAEDEPAAKPKPKPKRKAPARIKKDDADT
jgi:predicted regulator of Ras-like GTPase activity (Roadblock/LC7/MglB family)